MERKWEELKPEERTRRLAETSAMTMDIILQHMDEKIVNTFNHLDFIDKYEFACDIAKSFELEYCGTDLYENDFSNFSKEKLSEMIVKNLSFEDDVAEESFDKIEELVKVSAEKIDSINKSIKEIENSDEALYVEKYYCLASYLEKFDKILKPLKSKVEFVIDTGIKKKDESYYFVYCPGLLYYKIMYSSSDDTEMYVGKFMFRTNDNVKDYYKKIKNMNSEVVSLTYGHHYDIDYFLNHFDKKVFEESLYCKISEYVANTIATSESKLTKLKNKNNETK